MGLGPPICLSCKRICRFHEEPRLDSNNHKNWYWCSGCGSDGEGGAFMLDSKTYQDYLDNE